MKIPKLRSRIWLLFTLALGLLPVKGLAASDILLEADFENLNGQWPSGWPQKDHLSIESGDGNHFLRITSIDPGQMYLVYKEIPIPEGTEAIHFTWKERVTDLEIGKKSWHDARIMMEYLSASREGAGRPPNPHNGRNTDGWQNEELKFNVPENARTIKFMPCLFNVKAGTYDLDDLVMKAIPQLVPEEDPAHPRKVARQEKTEHIRDKASANVDTHGNIFPNGDFEQDSNSDGRPDGWGGGTFLTEDSNTFMRIHAKPDQLAMNYSKHALPSGVEALELTYDWRVLDLKPGKKAWFDARIMMNLIDSKGEKKSVGPIYTRRSRPEWQHRTKQFLVSDDMVYLEFMPSLFNVKSGILDIDNVSLKAVDPEPLKDRMAARKAERERLTVDPEEAVPSKWPPELKVKGNRLVDPQGREVWLQGVTIDSLEWSARGENILKSTQVAAEEWGANVIRLPIKESYWFDEKSGENYRKIVDDMITYAANRGVYTVLDLHRYRAARKEYVVFWKDAAERYKNHPAVLFDLLNEPHGTSWEVWRNGGFVKEKKKKADEDAFLTEEEKKHNARGFMSVGMQGLVDAVRETGARNIVVVGGLDWAYDLTGILDGYAIKEHPEGNGVMYSTHVYPWKSNWEEKFLEAAKKHPILVGEVGADAKKMEWMPAEHQEDWQTWVPRMLHTIQEHRLNWTAFSFHPTASPRMLLDWLYTPTPFWGKFVKQAFAGKQFDPDPIEE